MNKQSSSWVVWLAMYPLVLWVAVLLGQAFAPTISEFFPKFMAVIEEPFNLKWTENTLKAILILTAVYAVGVLMYVTSRKNLRPNEEHGSAQWGNPHHFTKKYANQKQKNMNIIFTENCRMGLDGYKHQRNLNVMVVGGSGAGKSRMYCRPNLYNCNRSFVITDPKGEALKSSGYLLEKQGYIVKVLDLVNMHRSHGYNPFQYLHTDADVMKLCNNIIRNTTPKNSSNTDPFWERAEHALLEAFVLYLFYEAPEHEKNFAMVMDMIGFSEARENDDKHQSPVDKMFERLRLHEPDHIAVKQYEIFKLAPPKTRSSILVSLGIRLEKFNLPALQTIMHTDELDMQSIGEKKTALFCVIPDNDTSFNFIVGMMYTQLFQELFYLADYKHDGRLKMHVHCLMDEFANVAQPEEFDKVLSTMRSREISVSIILQNMAQIKALYRDTWESLAGNCDAYLFLGGNEQSTHEYVSKLIGKQTIDTITNNSTKGSRGSYTTNYQKSGRELLAPNEVRMLDNENAILFVRGEKPILDRKYNIKKHPNIKLTADGGYKPYRHGQTTRAKKPEDIKVDERRIGDYVVLSGEDLEKLSKEKRIS